MLNNYIKPLKNLLTAQGNQLHSIGEKLRALQQLQAWVNDSVDEPLNQHCQVANFREGCLIICVESSAWAMQLRYQIPELLKKLRAIPALSNLRSINHYIQPIANPHHEVATHKPHLLSSENAALLCDVAENISDKDLQDALRRLSRHRGGD